MDIKEVEIKEQVYLSVEQYNTLKKDGSIVIDGETIEFNENADYITPDETAKNMTALRQEFLAKIQDAVATILDDEGATAAIDSFKELQDLLGSDTTGADGLIKQVNKNTKKIDNYSIALAMVDDVATDESGRCYILVPSIEKLYVGQRLNFSDTDDILISFDGNIPIATITEINTEKGYYGYTVYLDVNIVDNIPIGGYIYNAIPDAACRLFSKKVDKNTNKRPQAYGVNGVGVQTMWGIGSSDGYIQESTLAMYRAVSGSATIGQTDTGATLAATIPTQPYQVANKKYVDENASGSKLYAHNLNIHYQGNNPYVWLICFTVYRRTSTSITDIHSIAELTQQGFPVSYHRYVYDDGLTELLYKEIGACSLYRYNDNSVVVEGSVRGGESGEMLPVQISLIKDSGEYYIYDTVVEI